LFLPPGSTQAQDAAPSGRVDAVRTVMEQLVANHPGPFTHHPRSAFDARVEDLLTGVDELADHEFAVELLRLLALVGDGHTTLAGWWQLFPRAPLRIEVFEDGIYITAASAEHEDLIGARIDAIGTTPIAEALDRVAEVFAAENQWHRLFNFRYYLVMPAVLHARGLTSDPERFEATVTMPGGSTRSIDVGPSAGRVALTTKPSPDALPLYRRPGGGVYWSEVIDDQKTMYCRYDACRDDPEKPFGEFVGSMMASCEREGVERFVFDLRNNTGGNSMVARPLIRELASHPRLNAEGRIFVLIGRATFSSAMMNASEMRDQTEALLIGEPTGQKPNSFGEIISVDLEGTNLKLQVSTRYFHAFTDSDPVAIFPDFEVRIDAAQYFAGEDPVLQAAFDHVVVAEAAPPDDP
jgi:hypothetical protein